MPKFCSPEASNAKLAYIRSNATALHVIKAYALNDSYPTVVGNSVGSVPVVPADFALSDGAALDRVLTAAAKSATANAASGAAPNLHFAFVDAVAGRVLWVTDETTDQVIAIGNPLSIPSLTFTDRQPV